MVPDFDAITGETYHQLFAEDSILNVDVDETKTKKLLSKADLACLKRLVVKFRRNVIESKDNVANICEGDLLLDHAVWINELMVKRTETLQAAAKHEKNKNERSDHFVVTVSLFKKGLIAFEKQEVPLRRHIARLLYGKTEEGAEYLKQKAREEMAIIVKQQVEEYRKKQDEREAAEKENEKKNVEDEQEKLENGEVMEEVAQVKEKKRSDHGRKKKKPEKMEEIKEEPEPEKA